MSIVTQTDKRTGITYANDTTYYWDKEKRQSRSKRICVGKIDPETGDIVPTRGRAKKGSKSASGKPAKTGPKPFVETRHLYYGATYLLNEFANELGLAADLRQCFPETYKQLLSVAFYLILEDNNPLYRFEKWHLTHKHPYGESITSPRSSELFASITDDQVNKLFRLQGRRRVEDEYWAYDSTSISSYSETLAQIQYGKNKEDDQLPQLNLLSFPYHAPICIWAAASMTRISSSRTCRTAANTTRLSMVGRAAPCCHLYMACGVAKPKISCKSFTEILPASAAC